MTFNEMPDSMQQAVRMVIRGRRTTKVFASIDHPPTIDSESLRRGDEIVRQSIADAGWAPFHFDRKADGIAEPWRVHVLREESCRAIARNFAQWFPDFKPGNKMPAMLAACGCAVIVTWLPQKPAAGEEASKLINVNEEHLAATAAFVQNMLLLLDAAGLHTYWSSGGLLKTPEAFKRLGIANDQQLLACVFVDYAAGDAKRAVEIAGGGNRDKRSPAEKWSREITLA
jgi:nitroreductase